MIRIGHVIDSTFSWDQRASLEQLLARLPGDRYEQVTTTISGEVAKLAAQLGTEVVPLSCIGRLGELNGFVLSRFATRHRVDVWHAWGPYAAAAAVASRTPVVLDVVDPLLQDKHIRKIRTLVATGRLVIACGSRIVRRRLVERGVPLTAATVLRPGVDFAKINSFRRMPLREKLGIDREDFVVVLPQRIQRGDGHFDAVLAACLLNLIDGKIKVVLPGTSHERSRIQRNIASMPVPTMPICPGDDVATEQLVTMADALVIVPRGDIAATSIAWAMAGDTVVIGTATYAVAEMIANKVNGLLFKAEPQRRMVSDISPLLRHRDGHAKLKEVARGQAYEVFGVRRFVEQTVQLYDNVRAGASADTDINDPAMAG